MDGVVLTNRATDRVNLLESVPLTALGRAAQAASQASAPLAAIGQGLQGLGEAFLDDMREEQERVQALAETNYVNSSLDGFDQSMSLEFDRFMREEDPADPGFAVKLNAYADEQIDRLTSSQDYRPEVLQAFRQRAVDLKRGYFRQAVTASRAANAAAAEDGVASYLNQQTNGLLRAPGGLDDALARFEQRVADYDSAVDRNVSRDLISSGRKSLISSAVRGHIAAGRFDAADSLLTSGQFDADLDADTVRVLQKAVKTGRKDRAAAQESFLVEQAESEIARAGETGSVNETVFDRIDAVLGPERANDYYVKAARAARVRRTVDHLTALPPDQAEAALISMKPDPAAEAYATRDTFAADLADWKKTAGLIATHQEFMAKDPKAAVAQTVEKDVRQWRLTHAAADDAAEAEFRSMASRYRQRAGGRDVPRIFTNAEAGEIVESFTTADLNGKVAELDRMKAVHGDGYDAAITELTDNGLPAYAAVAATFAGDAQFRPIARDILAGATNALAKDIMPKEPEFAAIRDGAVAAVLGHDDRAFAGARAAANALFVTRMQRAGNVSGENTTDAETFMKDAVETVLGGTNAFNGERLVAPLPFLDQRKFARAMTAVADDHLTGAVLVSADGKTVQPLTAERFHDDAVLLTVSRGRYAIGLGAGVARDAETGETFVLDLGTLLPELLLAAPEPGRRAGGVKDIGLQPGGKP